MAIAQIDTLPKIFYDQLELELAQIDTSAEILSVHYGFKHKLRCWSGDRLGLSV